MTLKLTIVPQHLTTKPDLDLKKKKKKKKLVKELNL